MGHGCEFQRSDYERGYDAGEKNTLRQIALVFARAEREAFCRAQDDCGCCGKGMHHWLKQQIESTTRRELKWQD